MIEKMEACKWCGVDICFPTYPDIDGKPDLQIPFCSEDCCDAWLNKISGVDPTPQWMKEDQE